MLCYNCWKEIPDGQRVCPHCQAVAQHAFAEAGKLGGRRLDGCLPERALPHEFKATPLMKDLRQQVDLRASCPPIFDQGPLGSCASNAAVAALAFLEMSQGQFRGSLSRLFVYFNARRMRGTPMQDTGSSISEIMASLLAFGAPYEEMWPYDIAGFMVEPPPVAYNLALSNQAPEYARVDGADNVRAALSSGFPVVFGIHLPQRCYAEAAQSGRISEPTPGEMAHPNGGHAMLIVGYDLQDRSYLIRNSWGPGWGDGGYARASFDILDRYVMAGDFWILGSLEASKAFEVSRPAGMTAPGSAQEALARVAKIREEIATSVTTEINSATQSIRDRFRR